MNNTTSFNIEELEAERQWLYVAIEPEPVKLIGDIYPQLLTAWDSYQPDQKLNLSDIWEVVEEFTTANNVTSSIEVEEFVAAQIWKSKLARFEIVSPTISRVLSGRVDTPETI